MVQHYSTADYSTTSDSNVSLRFQLLNAKTRVHPLELDTTVLHLLQPIDHLYILDYIFGTHTI